MKNKQKAKGIKALLFDVDGVLTDGGIIYDNNGLEYKKFNVKDGQIIPSLRKYGLVLGVITGRNSQVVKNRCKELQLDFHQHGIKNKREEYEKFKSQYNLSDSEIAYMGDDIIDLSIISRCGLSAAPADAISSIKKEVDIVTPSKGGEGCFRDFADFILESQGQMEKIINQYKQ